MLLAKRWAMLQEQTDHYLGKQCEIVSYDLSSHMNDNKTSPLIPLIVNLQARLTGEGPFLCGTTGSTSYSSMTTPNLETPLGIHSLVNSLLTSHVELSTLVPASGNEHQLTYARVPTQPASGPGGFTNDRLRNQLQTILDWNSPMTQHPKFSF
jgi:hypothetical protein